MDPYPCNRVIANVLFKTSYLESWGNTKKLLHKNKCTTFAVQLYPFCIANVLVLHRKRNTFRVQVQRICKPLIVSLLQG